MDMWYHTMEEDVYFITMFSRRGICFPHIPMLLPDATEETHLAYVQRYYNLDITSTSEF
jgi:hypothetical protein